MPRVGPAIAESRARRAEIRPTGNTWQTTRGRRKQTPYARGKPSCCLTSFALPQHPPTPRALNPAAYAITTRTHTREDMPLRTTADRMKEQPTMREKAHLIASSLSCAHPDTAGSGRARGHVRARALARPEGSQCCCHSATVSRSRRLT